MPFLPTPMSRTGMQMNDWLTWRSMRDVEDVLRRERGLPDATASAPRRIVDGGALEIQAYDELCFPGLAGEWAQRAARRPFVGSLTMGLPTARDDEVLSWIAEGTPPIYFGFGSISVGSAEETIDMISSACAKLGERALIGAGGTDFSNVAHSGQVKVVAMMDYATVFPQCRAVVHHGGGGTTAAGLRGGVPQVICWTLPDQPLWGAVVKRLKVGTARRFSATTETTLVSDLRKVLSPNYRTHARAIASQMTKPADSVAATADLLEEFARLRGASA
jgi:UDP:flavonoid glycosyltransferase YjiC (YdhE family)